MLPGAGQSGLGVQPPLGHQRCRCFPGSRYELNPGKRRKEGKRMEWGEWLSRKDSGNENGITQQWASLQTGQKQT